MRQIDVTLARTILIRKMDEAINQMESLNIGYVPDEICSLMADAALNVVKTVSEVNEYFEDQKMLKE